LPVPFLLPPIVHVYNFFRSHGFCGNNCCSDSCVTRPVPLRSLGDIFASFHSLPVSLHRLIFRLLDPFLFFCICLLLTARGFFFPLRLYLIAACLCVFANGPGSTVSTSVGRLRIDTRFQPSEVDVYGFKSTTS